MSNQTIKVTSHVARDFLQNAAYFNSMAKVVWEYIANSLDAARDTLPAVIDVEITSNYVTISDNCRGMSREELSYFFQMHGENIWKKRGKRVRGRFGTGKCAAFGLANFLRIDTVQEGVRNVLELHRDDILAAKNGEAFPVRNVVDNEPVDQEDGTRVEIREFNIKRPNIDRVLSYVERHLSRYHQRAQVTVNGHECQFKEPPFIQRFDISPPEEVTEHIGDCTLMLKVSPVPLDDNLKGIDILSYGIWHGTTLAGLEKEDRANYLFGQIDVPLLEDGDWPIPAFDNTRNNTLNPQNPVVAVLLGWLAEELDRVRMWVVEREQARRKTETARKLAREARRISRVLNEDFYQQEFELEAGLRGARRVPGKSLREILEEQSRQRAEREVKLDVWEPEEKLPDFGGRLTFWEQGDPNDIPALIPWDPDDGDIPDEGILWELLDPEDVAKAQAMVEPESKPAKSSSPAASLDPVEDGEGAEETLEEEEKQPRRRAHAIFRIDFENATTESPRARYNTDEKTIYINLDHPQIAAAFEEGGRRTDARQFREICYEIITVEYALVIPREKFEKGELVGVDDALFEVRDTINRVTRRFMDVMHK